MARYSHFIFSQKNYSLILCSVCIIAVGFILMTGTGNHDSMAFNEDIYSFRRITLAPLIILSGYALMIFAIIAKPVGRKK